MPTLDGPSSAQRFAIASSSPLLLLLLRLPHETIRKQFAFKQMLKTCGKYRRLSGNALSPPYCCFGAEAYQGGTMAGCICAVEGAQGFDPRCLLRILVLAHSSLHPLSMRCLPMHVCPSGGAQDPFQEAALGFAPHSWHRHSHLPSLVFFEGEKVFLWR